MMANILSARDLMARWETQEELAIMAAIEDGLPCFDKNPYTWDIEAVNKDNIKKNLEIGRISFDNFVFFRSDVEKYEADQSEMQEAISNKGKAEGVSTLSSYAMLQQPVFKETLAAVKEIFAFCVENTSCKKEDAYELYLKKHPKLTERIFDSIWAVIPEGLKRKRGQRDH